jgi:PAS domain S-box-containing protein
MPARRNPNTRDKRSTVVAADSHLEFRRLLETLPAAAYTCDANGLITYFNRQAVALWGRQPKLNDPDDCYCGSFRLFTPEGKPIPHDECWMALALREGKSYNGEEIIIERQDGRRVATLAHANPFYDDRGVVAGAVNVLVDITGRKEVEQALRLSEERLRAMFTSAVIGIGIATMEGRFLQVNDAFCAITGYSKEELCQAHCAAITHADDIPRMQRLLDELKADKRASFVLEKRYLRKDQVAVWVRNSVSVAHDEHGRPATMIILCEDITAERRAEEERRQADRRKDEFLATLAHELRNPLAPIRNALHILRLAGDRPAALEQSRTLIERQVGQLVRLVDDLLDLSRWTRGKIELRRQDVVLESVVDAALETSQPTIAALNHQLTVVLPSEPVYLNGDPVRLAQVLSNLLNNAAKYTPPNGRLGLVAECAGGEVAIRIRDSGIGISAALLPRIFDLFVQGDCSLERARGGLGIGLTLVKCLVELHGGKVEAHSDGENQGSEFVVRLPLVAEKNKSGTGIDVNTVSAHHRGRRILIADDNHDAADSLAALLSIMGNEVRTAYDGMDAIQAAKHFQPDLVFLDIGMPRLNGYETCQQIRSQIDRNVMIVALTGWGHEHDKQRSQAAGFNEHLVKPLDAAALQRVLEQRDAVMP